MRLRNKKTGEIGTVKVEYQKFYVTTHRIYPYNTLAELFEEWEDYEEPKQWYGLNPLRDVGFEPLEYEGFEDLYKHAKELGIAFETKEEAEQAVRKLKAWKRLKDKGFRFRWIDMQTGQIKYSFFLEKGQKFTRGDEDDLLLLFGGEE